MSNMNEALRAIKSAGPFEVAGISHRMARVVSTPEQVLELARQLLRADATITHTDLNSSPAATARIRAVTDALNDLRDDEGILRKIALAYLNSSPPLASEIERTHSTVSKYIEEDVWFQDHAAAHLGAWVRVEGKHLAPCLGTRISLSDPISLVKEIAAKTSEINDQEFKREERREQRYIEKILKFPNEEVRAQYLKMAIQQEKLDTLPESPDSWVLKQIEEKHPRICDEVDSGKRKDFPIELIEKYRERYKKSPEAKAYEKLLEESALSLWRRFKEHELGLDDAPDSEREIRTHKQEDALLKEGANSSTVSKSRFYLEIDKAGQVFRLEQEGARTQLEGVSLIGTIQGETLVAAAGRGADGAAKDFYVSLFGKEMPSDIKDPKSFDIESFAEILHHDLKANRFATEVRVSKEISNPQYLLAVVADGSAPAHIEVIGAVWDIEPLDPPTPKESKASGRAPRRKK